VPGEGPRKARAGPAQGSPPAGSASPHPAPRTPHTTVSGMQISATLTDNSKKPG
jgi:hypothetical protein